jgi:hypothetical protein
LISKYFGEESLILNPEIPTANMKSSLLRSNAFGSDYLTVRVSWLILSLLKTEIQAVEKRLSKMIISKTEQHPPVKVL